jgi:lipopolysaccharide transport system ATP-binding protein
MTILPMVDLKLEHVSKRYLIRHQVQCSESGQSRLGNIFSSRALQEFWALRDVNFEVRRGEAVGIIGPNGAGKSTMLKLLSRIIAPTEGQITVHGKLAGLIEVGSGFHPELSGLENIYLSGSILGMRRRDIAKKLKSIVDFAGIQEFIDTPVKRYSSGMYVRLGFSIAAHLNPHILLLDEVLAVGDASFQNKCIERIHDLHNAGTTVLFISHDLNAVRRLCSRALLIEHGRIVANGPTDAVIARYMNVQQPASLTQRRAEGLCFPNMAVNVDARLQVDRVEALDEGGKVKQALHTGDYVKFRVFWHCSHPVIDGGISIGFVTAAGVPVISCSTHSVSEVQPLVFFQRGSNAADLEFSHFPLTSGQYSLAIDFHRPKTEFLYQSNRFAVFTVAEPRSPAAGYISRSDGGPVAVPHRWVTGISQEEAISVAAHDLYENL